MLALRPVVPVVRPDTSPTGAMIGRLFMAFDILLLLCLEDFTFSREVRLDKIITKKIMTFRTFSLIWFSNILPSRVPMISKIERMIK